MFDTTNDERARALLEAVLEAQEASIKLARMVTNLAEPTPRKPIASERVVEMGRKIA